MQDQEQEASNPPINDGCEPEQGTPASNSERKDSEGDENQPSATPTNAQAETPLKIRRRRNSVTIFPPLRLTVENQLKGLTFYADLSEGKTRGVSPAEVAARIGKSAQTVAGYSKFFTSLGLITSIERKPTFLPSDQLCQYANLLGTDPDRANEQLKPPIKKSWFGQAIISEIKVNGSRSTNQLVAALALIAEVKPTEKSYGAQLQQLIEWSAVSNLIQLNQDGTYSLVSTNGEMDDRTPDNSQQSENPPPPSNSPRGINKKGGKDAILDAVENTYRLSAIIELSDEEQDELLRAIKIIKKYAIHPAFNEGSENEENE